VHPRSQERLTPSREVSSWFKRCVGQANQALTRSGVLSVNLQTANQYAVSLGPSTPSRRLLSTHASATASHRVRLHRYWNKLDSNRITHVYVSTISLRRKLTTSLLHPFSQSLQLLSFRRFFADANCSSSANYNSGCTVVDANADSYGSAFAAAGGGVWVTELASTGVSIWFFSVRPFASTLRLSLLIYCTTDLNEPIQQRADVPSDLLSTNTSAVPDPTSWGLPSAYYANSGCDIDTYFAAQHLTLDITLCGDWVYRLSLSPIPSNDKRKANLSLSLSLSRPPKTGRSSSGVQRNLLRNMLPRLRTRSFQVRPLPLPHPLLFPPSE
jgi:hypothetical protein